MKTIKNKITSIFTILALPLVATANNPATVKPIEVVSIANVNGQIKLGIISSSKLNKIYFGSGLGGYDPENSLPTGSNFEDLAMESVTAIRNLCSQSENLSQLQGLEQQIAVGQNILLDLNMFSNSDQNCIRQIGEK